MSDDTGASPVSRRTVVKGATAGAIAATVNVLADQKSEAQEAYDAIVIGTGFGGTIATLALNARNKKALVIERGTFWVTPETLGVPPKSAAPPLPKWAADHNSDSRVKSSHLQDLCLINHWQPCASR